MDYRELENRMERNRELIKQRAYDRLIEEAKKANTPQRANWLAGLRAFLTALMQRKAKPQLTVELKPCVNSEIVKQRLS
jgi:hypothetical protein